VIQIPVILEIQTQEIVKMAAEEMVMIMIAAIVETLAIRVTAETAVIVVVVMAEMIRLHHQMMEEMEENKLNVATAL
jgi:hypothetical protein